MNFLKLIPISMILLLGCEQNPHPLNGSSTSQLNLSQDLGAPPITALNLLIQDKTDPYPRWNDSALNTTIVDRLPYGGRIQVTRYPKRPSDLSIDVFQGDRSLTHQKFSLTDKGVSYLILSGKVGAVAPFDPKLSLKLVPSGKESAIHFFHSVPEETPVDIYFNRKKVAENFHYGDMDDLDFTDVIREITLVPHGQTPSFDPSVDELHFTVTEHSIPTKTLLIFGLKNGQSTPGINKETVFVYPN